MHKSGFVNIIGRPNVGKSTLMNALVGERMSIITNKPQTTRHRIIGIVNGDDFQIVFSDTPGFVKDPSYKMHERMNAYVQGSFDDADLMLFVTDVEEFYAAEHPIVERLQGIEKVPKFLIINKVDVADDAKVLGLIKTWSERVAFDEIIPISALKGHNVARLLKLILERLPEGPEYYPKDQLTDRTERFFVSEIIRENILLLYRQEIPYSCEVIVEAFKEEPTSTHIRATIFVMRDSQKYILIGKKGAGIKQLGTDARRGIEAFLERPVFLELHVKVRENWRDDEQSLRHFGYEQ